MSGSPRHDIICIGASAGGVEAIRRVLAGLPADLAAAVFVVVHIPTYSPSMLPDVLGAAGPLPAAHAVDGEPIVNGRIYVAPPDRHMLFETGRVLVRFGPKENRFRPSVDALFRSAAFVYGPRVIGVVMSGVLDDGTSGLWSIKRFGGIAIVQKPEEALHPEMPRSAMEQVEIDHVSSAAELGPLLAKLSNEPVASRPSIDDGEMRRLGFEIDVAARAGAFDQPIAKWGEPAPFSCPDCHGVLVRFDDGPLLRFRCHTGHAFTPRALVAGISDAIEDTMAQTLRGLEEQTTILERMAEHSRRIGQADNAELFATKARESGARAQAVRDALPLQQQLSFDLGTNGR